MCSSVLSADAFLEVLALLRLRGVRAAVVAYEARFFRHVAEVLGDIAFVASSLVAILAISQGVTILDHIALHFDLLAARHLAFLVDLLLLVVLIIKISVWVVELLWNHAVMMRYIFHDRFWRPLIGHAFRPLVDQGQIFLQNR